MYYKVITAYRNGVKVYDIAKMYALKLTVVVSIVTSAQFDKI